MALSNQPYLPLYVNDWLSNTKLKQCSANAHGVMINLMLLMHKEDDYGIILLKQKFKQTDKQILNFASQLAKLLPFDLIEIQKGISELVEEEVIVMDGDLIKINRMIKDADISLKRSLSGSKGGKETMKKPIKSLEKPKTLNDFASDFAQAKIKAKPEIEIEYAIDIILEYLNKKVSKDFKKTTKETKTLIFSKIKGGYSIEDFKKVIDIKSQKWLGDPAMVDYLRPSTLFGNKFESYLNEHPASVISKKENQVKR